MTKYPSQICQSDILNRGWTKSMIEKLLPEPILKQNPYNSNSHIKKWNVADVESAEQSQAFAEISAAAARRKASAQKAVRTKENQQIAMMQEAVATAHIKVLDDSKLRHKAYINAYNHQTNNTPYRRTPEADIDEDTMQRWVVNYIRHFLVKGKFKNAEYDQKLYSLKGKVGKQTAYTNYKCGLLDRIAELYPKYAAECERQKQICLQYLMEDQERGA